jgi:hypothetical protein
MHNKTFAAEIAHGVSSRKRTTILERSVLFNASLIQLTDLAFQGEGSRCEGDKSSCTSAVRGVDFSLVPVMSLLHVPRANPCSPEC